MRWIFTLALLASFAIPGLAQDNAEKSPEQQAREAAERRVGYQMRAYRSLNLSEAQTEQLKKILVDEELASNKRRDARRDKIRKLLTPDQKEQFEQMVNRRRGGGEGGRRGGRGGGGMMGRMGMDANAIKERLKLTDEQTTKIQAIMTESGAKAMEKVREMRNQGGFDFGKMREIFEQVRKDVRKQIEPLLTDEQKPEFAKLNKEMDERMSQWMGRSRGGRSERGNRERGRRAPSTDEIIKKRVAAAMEALSFSEEEASVIQPLVLKLVTYQVKGGKSLRDQREAIGKVEGEAEIRNKIGAYRKARGEFTQKLKLMSAGLRELLTVQQEAKLFALRVFDLPEESSASTTAPDDK